MLLLFCTTRRELRSGSRLLGITRVVLLYVDSVVRCSTNYNRRRSCLPSLRGSHDAATEALGVIGVLLLGAASVTDSAVVPCIARDNSCLSSLVAVPTIPREER
jgi:hypothetical protein